MQRNNHNFPSKKKRKKKWCPNPILHPPANVHIAQRLTSNGLMDIFIPTSSTLSQPHDAINSIIRENNDEDRNISKLVENK